MGQREKNSTMLGEDAQSVHDTRIRIVVHLKSQTRDQDQWPPPNGGISHICEMSAAWAKKGCDVQVLTNPNSPIGRWLMSKGVQVSEGEDSCGPAKETTQRSKAEADVTTGLAAVSDKPRESGPTVVIAASPYPKDLFGAILLALGNRGPRIVYFHHLIKPPSYNTKSRGGILRTGPAWLYQELALQLSRIVRFAVALNETSDYRFLARHRPPRSMAIQACLSSALTQSESLVEPVYDACFSGRISPQKGIWDLLLIWRKVCDSRPSAKLAIVGPKSRLDDSLRKEWIQLGMDENITRVSAALSGAHWEIVRTSRVFLFPSYEEGWSLAVMEAAWLSVPVVAYDLPAYSYLQNALLSHPPGDIEGMSNSVIRLLADEEGRRRLVARAKARIGNYMPGVVASRELRSILSLAQ